MISEPVRSTIQLAEACQTWATIDAWAKALGVSQHELQRCLEGGPSRPVWVRLDEFTYIDEAYEAETVAQACEDLLTRSRSTLDFSHASEEVLEHARMVAGEVQERVNRVLEFEEASEDPARNRIRDYLS